MNNLSKIKKAFAKFSVRKDIEIPAFLGDLSGTVIADANSNVYVVLFNGQVMTVRNVRVPNVPRLPVVIGYEGNNPNLLQVLRARDAFDAPSHVDLPAHAEKNHAWPNVDTLWVRGEQILPGLAIPSALTVQLVGFVYYLSGFHLLDNQTIDLSGEVPASGANYVLVEVDASGVITFNAGSAVASREVLTPADIPTPTANTMPLFAVKMYVGQTEILKSLLQSDIVDLRWSRWSAGGGGSGAWGGITGTLADQTDLQAALNLKVPYTVLTDTKEPTGWLDPAAVDAAMTYDSTTQKISISGTHYYYWRGVKASITNLVSSAHTNTVGHIYRLYSVDGVNFTWSTDTEWAWTDIMVASVNYQTAYKYAVAEPHGLMQWEAHEEFHRTIGTYKESGGTLDGATYTIASTTAAQRRPNVVQTVLHDEDIEHTLAALTSKTYNKFYLSSTNTVNFTGATADIVPLLAANPYYNLFSTPNWTQVLMAANSYSCVWLVGQPVTGDAGSQAFRYFWVQGQSNGTLAQQQGLTPADVSFGALSDEVNEFVFLVKIIIRFNAGDWVLTSVTNLNGNRFIQTGTVAGTYLSSVATNGSLTGDGSTGNPLSASSGATTATAVGNTVLLVTSATMQEFTGTTTQTVTMPVVTTLRLGHRFVIINNSTGLVTINSSGGNAIATVAAGTTVTVYCVLITGTTAASWTYQTTLSAADNTEAVAFMNGGTGTHTAMDSHIASTSVHVTNGDTHDHVGGDGAVLPFLFPFATYITSNPISITDSLPYGGTAEAAMSFIKWSQGIYATAAHSASNYWTMQIYFRPLAGAADVQIAIMDTKTATTGSRAYNFSTTTFAAGSIAAAGYFYVYLTKTGTPGDIYILCPALRCKLT